MDNKQTTSLICALQNGDKQAASEIYDVFYNDIYYFILKTVKDPELAADLTQDTFIEILETIGNLRVPAAFLPWSKKIAYHKCTAYLRKRKDLLADDKEDGYSILDLRMEERREFIPDESLDQVELQKTICDMIDALPEEQRSAIIMRYYDEMSVRDIAKIQNTTEGTIKSRLNYGRKAIKQSVEEYEKKNQVQLHCIGIVPILLWFFKESRLSKGISLTQMTPTAEAFATVITKSTKKLIKRLITGIMATLLVTGGAGVALSGHSSNSSDSNMDIDSEYESSSESQENESVEIATELTEDESTEPNSSDAMVVEELFFTLSNDGSYYIVSGIGTYADEHLIIPTEHKGLPVTTIKAEAFNNEKIISLTIPSSITYIESRAFIYMESLSQITVAEENPVYHSSGNCIIDTFGRTLVLGCKNSIIPTDGSVRIIGEAAFLGCSGLTSITIPDNIISISERAFCTSGLTNIDIPDSVQYINLGAFIDCDNLSKVSIGNNVVQIGASAFAFCDNLTDILIPNSVTQIGSSIFGGCNKLKSITIENGNPTYHSAGNCIIETSTKTIIAGCNTSIIPTDGSVTRLESYAFDGCRNLTNITIPNTITYIGPCAFWDCFYLSSITIPSSVTCIEFNAFFGCENLTDIYYDGSMGLWNSITEELEFPSSSSCIVHCTDGEITLEPEV